MTKPVVKGLMLSEPIYVECPEQGNPQRRKVDECHQGEVEGQSWEPMGVRLPFG